MVDTPEQTKSLNKTILFLTLVVVFATICSLAISILALPSDSMEIGIWIETIFIVIVLISGYLINKWDK
jgi:hypothetical protein